MRKLYCDRCEKEIPDTTINFVSFSGKSWEDSTGFCVADIDVELCDKCYEDLHRCLGVKE